MSEGVCIAEESLLPLLYSPGVSVHPVSPPEDLLTFIILNKGWVLESILLRELLWLYPVGKAINTRDWEFTPVFHSCLVAECLLPEVLRIPCKHITILMAVRWKSAWLFVWGNLNSSFQISKEWAAICSSIFVLSPSQPHAKTRMFYYHLLVLVIRFFNLPFPLLLPFALSESVELTETELFQCLKEKLDISAMRHSLTAY